MNQTILRGVAIFILIGLTGIARAEDPLPDKFRLSIGGFNTTRTDATLSVTDPDVGIGVSLNPRDAFDLDTVTTVLRIEGHYRFNQKHALTYGWYNIETNGHKSVESEIDWVDREGNAITIPVGASLDSNVDTEIFKLGYLWSFYKSNKMEVAIGGGLHVTSIVIDLDSTLTNPPKSTVKTIDSTLPLPVASMSMSYKVTDKFTWYLKSEAFALAFDDYRGAFRDTVLGMEYRFWRHVGLGVALTTNSLQLDEDNDDYKLRYDNGTTGGMVYLSSYF